MNIPIIPPQSSENHFMEGYVIFLSHAVGSKSEGLRPFLIRGDAPARMLYREGDNPLTNDCLRPYHGKFCQIHAREGKLGSLLVEEVRELSDPMSADHQPTPSS